ncbi:PREDICTED: uncharacterized protein LOC104799549 [Tarenaya hassleriana]|uniref:uncharacterized protein LOC104799549 n=1 Tax=Tarenaya hassleriana TaxID=28532 RepID=UPI00053C2102|nr:PREDICTED: uncharacterized protein LOC104799549 [Tarenaya hassleriana]
MDSLWDVPHVTFKGMVLLLIAVATAFAFGIIEYAFRPFKPPPSRVCGVGDGPPITSPRIKLGDGRHLSYRETGVSIEESKHKVIIIHGFDSSKDLELPISQELIEEFKIYILQYDRAGYGESDPYPSRSVKTEAYDVQELADKLHVGPKFHVIGLSLGCYAVYSCIKYIPHRLAGASLVVPVVNYWWKRVPGDLLREGFRLYNLQDRWAYRVSHYVPWLFHWWTKQQWLTRSCMMAGNTYMLTPADLKFLEIWSENPIPHKEKIRQQGEYESVHRDVMVAYGKWEFDPTELDDPFPSKEGSVHLWQGLDDKISPLCVNRYISRKLPWVKLHEVPRGGHLMVYDQEICQAVLRMLLVG